MRDFNSRELSADTLSDILAGGEKRANVEEMLGNYVLMRNREISIVDRVMPPQIVSANELQRDPSDPENAFIEVIERESMSGSAMIVPFDGETAPQFIRSTYYVVRYNVIASPTYKRYHHRMAALEQDILDVVDKNIVEKIGNVKDTYFFNAMEAIFAAYPNQSITAYNLATVYDPTPGNGDVVEIRPFNEPDFWSTANSWHIGARRLLVHGFKKFSENALPVGVIVMPETVWAGIYDWSQAQLHSYIGDIVIFGTNKVTETKMLFNKPIITTQKVFTRVDPDTGEEVNVYAYGTRPREIELTAIYDGGAGYWVDAGGNGYNGSPASTTGSWIYMFTEPNKLGKNGIVDKIHFYADSGIIAQEEMPMIALQAWGRFGVGIANTRGVARMAIPDPTTV